MEGPRVSPRHGPHGQLVALWPPQRREESSELKQLRAECQRLLEQHREDQIGMEDVAATVAEVRFEVQRLRERVEAESRSWSL